MEIFMPLRGFLWNYVFIPLFIAAGFVSVFFVFGKYDDKKTAKSVENISPIRTLFVNLGSTVGTGNIAGVALAITAGGAGSIFWMWAAALFGMMVSYTENVLGIIYRDKNNYPVPYMTKKAAKLFSFFCILASFGMGNMVQSNSAAAAAKSLFKMPEWLSGAVMAACCFLIIFKGISSILKFTDKFVPFMAFFYIAVSVAIIYINRGALPEVFHDIFREALSLKAILGGTAATGIARGVFSGEAGLGSAVILSSKSNVKSAKTQGKAAMCTIFIDTIIICTLTALTILTSKSASAAGAFYKTLGALGGQTLNLSIIFFCFTTLIGWSYFGECCAEFLFGQRSGPIYKVLFALFIFLGAILKAESAWSAADVFNALMAVPNLIFVIFAALNTLQRGKKKSKKNLKF